MGTLGSEHHPIIVKVNSEEKATRVTEICEEYGFKSVSKKRSFSFKDKYL